MPIIYKWSKMFSTKNEKDILEIATNARKEIIGWRVAKGTLQNIKSALIADMMCGDPLSQEMAIGTKNMLDKLAHLQVKI